MQFVHSGMQFVKMYLRSAIWQPGHIMREKKFNFFDNFKKSLIFLILSNALRRFCFCVFEDFVFIHTSRCGLSTVFRGLHLKKHVHSNPEKLSFTPICLRCHSSLIRLLLDSMKCCYEVLNQIIYLIYNLLCLRLPSHFFTLD